VSFTQAPGCGDGSTPLAGIVRGVPVPADYVIAPYIYSGTWWTKPTFASPTTPLVPAGGDSATFSVDISSHPNDVQAGYITAFLVPAGITPPVADGLAALPAELFVHAHAETTRECATRVLSAFGRAWWVKDSGASRWGPGPNYFGGGPGSVWVDAEGRIHLRVFKSGAKWYCAEVVDVTADPALSSPGFGTYAFQALGDLDALDPNLVLGLFTWDTYAPEVNYREIDFEASRWSNPGDPTNCQFVVQPYGNPGNLVRFTAAPGETMTTQAFSWSEDDVAFASWSGFGPRPPSPVFTYEYDGPDVPPAGSATANTRFNLWLVNGNAPTDGQPAEIVIAGFTYAAPGNQVGLPEPGPGPMLSVSPNPSRGPVAVTAPRGGTLAVLDVAGRVVWSAPVAAGSRTVWDGRGGDGRAVAPGLYFLRVASPEGTATRRITRLP